MKLIKIFLLLFTFAIVGPVVQSQVIMKPSQTILTYTGVATDTLKSSAAGPWDYSVYPNKETALKLDFQMKLNRSVSTTYPKCTVKVQGKKFDTDASWTDVASMTVTIPASGKGLSSDTTLTLSQVTTAQYYRYFRVLVSGTSVTGNPVMNIGFVKWKFYK